MVNPRERTDIVTEILELVRSECHSVDASALERIEERVRITYGGTEPYIMKRAKPSREEVTEAVSETRSGRKAAQKLQIPKTTLYRILQNRTPR